MTTLITDIVPTDANAKALRAVNKFGMNLADFAALTTTSRFTGFGNGTSYTVSQWISDGVFANLAAVQAVYPVCQSGTDTVDWVLLQSAVDFIIYGSLGNSVYGSTKRKLLIPAGLFKCNHPLQLGYARIGTPPTNLNGNGYVSITLEGEGPHYDSSGNGMTGTTVNFTFTDNVGISLNRNVQSILRGLTVKGSYTYATNYPDLSSAGVWDLTNWKDPALASANWIGGNAVNVGIGFDVHTTAASAAAYPARILPSYFGGGTSTAQISAAGGSDYLIEDVNVSQFVIGVGHPYGDQNSEFIRFHRGIISGCPYGVTLGHSQNRNASFRDVNFSRFHTAICNEGGNITNGNLHGAFDNIHAAYGYQVYNNTQSWSGPIKFSNLYVEGVYRWGSAGGEPINLDSCYFSFYDAGGVGLSPTNHFAGGNITLNNCTIAARNGVFIPQITNNPVSVKVENCSIQTWVAPTLSGNALEGSRYMNSVFGVSGSGARSIQSNTLNLGSLVDIQSPIGGFWTQVGKTHAGMEFIDYAPSFADLINLTGSSTLMGGVYRYAVPRIGARSVSLGTMASRSGLDIVFPRYSFGSLKVDEGDIFFINGAGSLEYVCVVTSISGGNMTLRQLNGYFSSSQFDYQTDGNTQLTAGNSYTATYVCARVRYNPYLVLGETTAGSTTIAKVKHGLGSGSSVSTTHLTMAAGDYLIHTEPDILNVGGSPTSPLNLVTNVNTAAQTITLTNAMTKANTCYPVVFYVKVFNA